MVRRGLRGAREMLPGTNMEGILRFGSAGGLSKDGVTATSKA